MNESCKRCWILLLFAIVSAIGTSEVLAQSKTTASKRSFAILLARKAKAEERRAEKEIAVTQKRIAHSTLESTHAARLATVKPVTPSAVYGIAAATNVVPPSGYGPFRDAFIEAFYPLVLGRPATQRDVDFWARAMAEGQTACSVAEAIWHSPEHKALEESGQAPDIPLQTAYRRSYAIGEAAAKASRHRAKG